MKHLRSTLLTVIAIAPVIAYAHARLKSSTPVDGGTVAASPASITLMFSEAVRLTALRVQRNDGAKDEQKLGPLPEKASAHLSVPAPHLTPGAYTIHWRAVGKDNHVMSGAIRFTLSVDGKTSAGRTAKPDRPAEHDPHSH